MAKLSKIGSKKKKPSAKRYLSEERWTTNKEKRAKRRAKAGAKVRKALSGIVRSA